MNASTDGAAFTVKLAHGPSGTTLDTEPPKDNGGTGLSFSPTDLVGAALASCALTTMALTAKRENLAWGAARAKVVKRMSPPPRRIAELELVFTLPASLSLELRRRYEEIAHTCPVARSLHPDVKLPMRFDYKP
jgi:uncharacterized OsmC-like protein